MKTKNFNLILPVVSVLLFMLPISFHPTFALDTPSNSPTNSSSEVPKQSSTLNREVPQSSGSVAPSEATPPPKTQSSNPPTATSNQRPTVTAAPTPTTPPAPTAPSAPPPVTNTPPPAVEKPQTTNPPVVEHPAVTQKTAEKDNDASQNKLEDKPEDAINNEESKTPEDLPEVESDEILFPEVMSPSESTNSKPKNLLAGVIAWTCIALGVAIVVFVLVKGRHKGDIEPKTMKVHNSRHKKKTKRLLDDKYYKKR